MNSPSNYRLTSKPFPTYSYPLTFFLPSPPPLFCRTHRRRNRDDYPTVWPATVSGRRRSVRPRGTVAAQARCPPKIKGRHGRAREARQRSTKHRPNIKLPTKTNKHRVRLARTNIDFDHGASLRTTPPNRPRPRKPTLSGHHILPFDASPSSFLDQTMVAAMCDINDKKKGFRVNDYDFWYIFVIMLFRWNMLGANHACLSATDTLQVAATRGGDKHTHKQTRDMLTPHSCVWCLRLPKFDIFTYVDITILFVLHI